MRIASPTFARIVSSLWACTYVCTYVPNYLGTYIILHQGMDGVMLSVWSRQCGLSLTTAAPGTSDHTVHTVHTVPCRIQAATRPMSSSLFLVRLVVWAAPSVKDHCLWNMEMLWRIGPVRRPNLSKCCLSGQREAYCQ
ncbi:hypothetical protein F5Y03DRAFT_264581 [Xylaria venustula]|nr:hypothetical protein F5Y03DRAFT_264581 [Xylaria venustula]